nr:uncharacterized protein LOC105492356 isoform X2 [Macaca nemestrina]
MVRTFINRELTGISLVLEVVPKHKWASESLGEPHIENHCFGLIASTLSREFELPCRAVKLLDGNTSEPHVIQVIGLSCHYQQLLPTANLFLQWAQDYASRLQKNTYWDGYISRVLTLQYLMHLQETLKENSHQPPPHSTAARTTPGCRGLTFTPAFSSPCEVQRTECYSFPRCHCHHCDETGPRGGSRRSVATSAINTKAQPFTQERGGLPEWEALEENMA